MARMLQALKNLEARSKRPAAAGGVLGHLADKLAPSKPPAQTAANPAQPAIGNAALVPVYLQAQPAMPDASAPIAKSSPPAANVKESPAVAKSPDPQPPIKRDRFG